MHLQQSTALECLLDPLLVVRVAKGHILDQRAVQQPRGFGAPSHALNPKVGSRVVSVQMKERVYCGPSNRVSNGDP